MSLINGLIRILGSLESDQITIHEERCISVRNRNADCLRCADACTSSVIVFDGNELILEPDRCIGCGSCATACPTCAIEMKNPSDDELVAAMKRVIVATNGHPVFACEEALQQEGTHSGKGEPEQNGRRGTQVVSYDETKVCMLPCLGRIDEALLVGLAAYKARDVSLVCGSCDTCTRAPGGTLVREVMDSSRALLDAFGCAFPLMLTDTLPDSVRTTAGVGKHTTTLPSTGTSRRDFLTAMKHSSSQAASTAVAEALGADPLDAPSTPPAYRKVNANGTLSHFVPTRRTRVYNYLKHIGEPIGESVDTRIIGSVAIDATTCSSCRMCAVFCPTGALTKLDGPGEFGILHRPSACMQCRLCESICPQYALTVSSTVPISQFMGKQAIRFAMKQPTWTPNKPDSMYSKVHGLIGPDKEMCMF